MRDHRTALYKEFCHISNCKCYPLKWRTDSSCLLYPWFPLYAHDRFNLKPYNSSLSGGMAFCYGVKARFQMHSVHSISLKDLGVPEWVFFFFHFYEKWLYSRAILQSELFLIFLLHLAIFYTWNVYMNPSNEMSLWDSVIAWKYT